MEYSSGKSVTRRIRWFRESSIALWFMSKSSLAPRDNVLSNLGAKDDDDSFTSQLSEPSRWVIIGLMFAGRIGPLPVVTDLSRPRRAEQVDLPEADPLIG